MSIKLMTQVWSMKCQSATQKLILLKLADNADDSGECWPSMSNIADKCGCDRRTVVRHIEQLCELGLVERQHRSNKGFKTSNRYHLHLFATSSDKMSQPAHDVTHDHNGSDTRSQPDVTHDHNGSDTRSHKPSITINNEPSKNTSINSAQSEDCFERVWKNYPTKVGKKKSKELFASYVKKNKLNPEQFAEQLIRDIDARCEVQQFGFDKLHFTTYINQQRWTDEIKKPVDTSSRLRAFNFTDEELGA